MALPSDLVTSLKGAHPKEFLEEMKRKERQKHGLRWVLRNEIAPSDLYCYLGARFGAPNGLQNFLRKDDSDNLIHWEWCLRCGEGWITIQGMNFRTEIWLTAHADVQDADLKTLVVQFKADFPTMANRCLRFGKRLRTGLSSSIPIEESGVL